MVEHPVLPEGGGSIPTSPLQRLRKSDWTVARADQDIAYRLVAAEHYAKGASNTATYLHGLYPAGWKWWAECVGVAWWIPPTRSAAEALAGVGWQGVLALSRLVIEPGIPSNACSFLLSKSVRMIAPARWPVLVTYADSWRGHTGAIYLAAGWAYDGETAPEPTYTLNGRMIARKAGGHTRTHGEMLAMGCVCEKAGFQKGGLCCGARALPKSRARFTTISPETSVTPMLFTHSPPLGYRCYERSSSRAAGGRFHGRHTARPERDKAGRE